MSLAALATYNLENIRHAGWWLPAIAVVALIIGLIASAMSWAFTRFAVDGGEVHIDSGVLFRRSRQVRIDRLQAIDIVQPLLARAFGLAELKLDMAGGAEGRVRLGYLRLDEAQALRAALLAMAAGLDHRTPEAPQRPLVHCSGGAIVGGALLSTQALIGFIWVVAFLAGAIASRHPGVFTGALPGVVSVFGAVWQTIQQHFGFTVADSPDGLRLRHGLFETRAQTVPPGRVQAVRIVQPLLWRMFGWVRVDANIAGYAGHRAEDGRQHNSVLLPVGTRAQALLVVGRALPGVDIDAVRDDAGSGAREVALAVALVDLSCWCRRGDRQRAQRVADEGACGHAAREDPERSIVGRAMATRPSARNGARGFNQRSGRCGAAPSRPR